MAKVPKVFLLGAFERHNFGDLLLGEVAESLLSPSVSAVWLTPFAGATPKVDQLGYQVVPISRLDLSRVESVPVIHVGGETLKCDWSLASEMSEQPIPWRSRASNRSRPYITPESESSPSHGARWGKRIFFGMGGSSLSAGDIQGSARTWHALRTASWLSVRDPIAFQELGRSGLEVALHPDLATLTPPLSRPSPFGGDSPGLVCQFSSEVLQANFREILSLVTQASRNFDRVTVAVAGTAPRHDSADLSAQFAQELQRHGVSSNFVKTESTSMVVDVVGRAEMVLCTSLHFRILAMAFAIPRVTIRNSKSQCYAEHWDISPFSITDFGNAKEVIGQACRPTASQLSLHAGELREITARAWLKAMERMPVHSG